MALIAANQSNHTGDSKRAWPSGPQRTDAILREICHHLHDPNRPTAQVAMDKDASPKADKTPQTSPEAPFTMFIQLDGKCAVPSQFRVSGTFTITRLQSPVGLPDRITKSSPVPALLVSISLKSLPSSRYQVWASDKLIPTSVLHPHFALMSSISIHTQGAGQAVRSITFTILFLVRG